MAKGIFMGNGNELPTIEELERIPVGYPHSRPRFSIVEKYLDIISTGKAAVYPQSFNSVEEANEVRFRFEHCIRYYKRYHPEMEMPSEIGFRTWYSDSANGVRWAMLPVKNFGSHRSLA